LIGKRLARNPAVAEVGTRDLVLGRALFLAPWRLDHVAVLRIMAVVSRIKRPPTEAAKGKNRRTMATQCGGKDTKAELVFVPQQSN
jgi:hypothetical protein